MADDFLTIKGREITPLGRYIRRLRVENQITLLDMAQALGMNPSELCGIETGDIERPPFFACAVSVFFRAQGVKYDEAELFRLANAKDEK